MLERGEGLSAHLSPGTCGMKNKCEVNLSIYCAGPSPMLYAQYHTGSPSTCYFLLFSKCRAVLLEKVRAGWQEEGVSE